MYFNDRTQAGDLLANQLMHYRYENTTVLALSAGGVVVGEQIAKRLHCGLQLLLTKRISAPGDPSLVLGTMTSTGDFSYNNLIPAAVMEGYLMDMRGYLEEAKLQSIYDMSLLGEGGLLDMDHIWGRNIILATDGVKNGMSFEAARHFLKLIHTEKLVGAVPIGPADVMERLGHELDEFHYLYIPDNFISINHYYEDNDIPGPELITETINHIIARWV